VQSTEARELVDLEQILGSLIRIAEGLSSFQKPGSSTSAATVAIADAHTSLAIGALPLQVARLVSNYSTRAPARTTPVSALVCWTGCSNPAAPQILKYFRYFMELPIR
jgi:hypothetical protein